MRHGPTVILSEAKDLKMRNARSVCAAHDDVFLSDLDAPARESKPHLAELETPQPRDGVGRRLKSALREALA